MFLFYLFVRLHLKAVIIFYDAVTELLGYRHRVTPSESMARETKIKQFPCRISCDGDFCNICVLQSTSWLLLAIVETDVKFIGEDVALQFSYHVTCIDKMSYPALILCVKSRDAAPPLYVTEQLTPRRLACSMTA